MIGLLVDDVGADNYYHMCNGKPIILTSKIYLVIDLTSSDYNLTEIIKSDSIGCARIANPSDFTNENLEKARILKKLCKQNNIPILLEDNHELAVKEAFDGVHFRKPPKNFKEILKHQSLNFFVGVNCAYSKHMGMLMAEAGADYIAFSKGMNRIITGMEPFDYELISWWNETIETPLVVENSNSIDEIKTLSETCDFISISAKKCQDKKYFNKVVSILQKS